ncbi:MAG: hypothetical protein HC811_04310 [Flammeovirgaceae bacterium]|nr:hypothetical protein [Flammeovirgaceae bacterium]
MIETNSLQFNFSARYYKIGNATTAKKIWFVLHGYGQLAQFFIKKFNVLKEKDVCVIAPEGLSKFYTHRNPDRIGATWMTRENRLMDIDNYITYLDSIYHHEIKVAKEKEVTLLGFSQGAATASRWAQQGNISYGRLILWAGIFPPDMHFDQRKDVLKNKKIIQVYGKTDPFLNDSIIVEMKDIQTKLNVTPETLVFDGGHEIDEETLSKLF